PEFTHQLFDEECIKGYEEGEVAIQVVLGGVSLACLVKIDIQGNKSTNCREDIMSQLSNGLPEGYTSDKKEFEAQLGKEKEFEFPGQKIHEYARGGTTFFVHRATGNHKGACEYHAQAERLAIWYIETADSIDLKDDRWEIFYIFGEKQQDILNKKERRRSLVGYFTAFNFRNPIKGISFRICQALVFPMYQRQGKLQYALAFLEP
ncbi:unnamed protein product, partial [Choristocarpus tenellus]